MELRTSCFKEGEGEGRWWWWGERGFSCATPSIFSSPVKSSRIGTQWRFSSPHSAAGGCTEDGFSVDPRRTTLRFKDPVSAANLVNSGKCSSAAQMEGISGSLRQCRKALSPEYIPPGLISFQLFFPSYYGIEVAHTEN